MAKKAKAKMQPRVTLNIQNEDDAFDEVTIEELPTGAYFIVPRIDGYTKRQQRYLFQKNSSNEGFHVVCPAQQFQSTKRFQQLGPNSYVIRVHLLGLVVTETKQTATVEYYAAIEDISELEMLALTEGPCSGVDVAMCLNHVWEEIIPINEKLTNARSGLAHLHNKTDATESKIKQLEARMQGHDKVCRRHAEDIKRLTRIIEKLTDAVETNTTAIDQMTPSKLVDD